MQYRLSTIFLIFFVTATSLALMGAIGLWTAFVICIAALAFNKAKTKLDGAIRIFYVLLIGIICPGLLMPTSSRAGEAARRACCANNMKQIGLGLHNYHDFHHHFPPLIVCDKDGKPLYNWMVPILPCWEYDFLYQQLHKDEPWDSEQNAKVLNIVMNELYCPSALRQKNEFSTNYIAIVGPGTAWRKEGTVSLMDIANPSLTVMAVECAESDKHWAEPYVLTMENVLERMKTGEGMRISFWHPGVVGVLFADGSVRFLQNDMPISVWRKLLMGEIKNIEELDNWQETSNDELPINISLNPSPPQRGEWTIILGIVVWLIAVVLLFHRAWASRIDQKKADTPAA